MSDIVRASITAMGVLGFTLAGTLAAIPHAGATELVYRPINPSFGGDPFAGSHLMDTAQVQNRFAEDGFAFPDFDFGDVIIIGDLGPGEADETGEGLND